MSDLVPIGTYKARAVSSTFGESSNGNQYINVRFNILDGECAGQSVYWRGFFTEATEKTSTKALTTMGFDGRDWLAITETHQDCSALFPNEVDLVVTHKDGDDGVTRAEVRWVNAPGGSAGIKAAERPLEPSKARAFAARMAATAPKPAAAPRPAVAPAQRGTGPGGSTVTKVTSSANHRPAPQPPPGQFDDGAPDYPPDF